MHQPKQLQLFEIVVQPQIKSTYDPYWDELEAQTDDIVDDALLSIDAENKVFDVDAEIAHQQIASVGEQSSCINSACTSVGEQVLVNTSDDTAEIGVGGQVLFDTEKVAHQHDKPATHWVEKYWVERGTNKYWYYRYTWMSGRKLHRVYIGSARSPKANRKKQAVEDAIFYGQSPQQIKDLLQPSSR